MNLKRCVLSSLAVAVLVIGSTHAARQHKEHHSSSNVEKTTVTTISSVRCEATASGKAAKSSRDAIVVAVASAFDAGCGKHDDGFVKRVEVAYSGWAEVFASAVTSATAKCTTSGNAYGCAAATSYAKSIAKATVAAFASAVSQAAAGCNCLTEVEAGALAKAFGSAATFEKLTALAESSVSAAVCAANGQSASASIYQVCLASASSKVFAKATAEALAASNCHSADAIAKIKAVTGATTYITEGCETTSSQGGSGQTGTGSEGSGFVDIEDFLKKAKGKQ